MTTHRTTLYEDFRIAIRVVAALVALASVVMPSRDAAAEGSGLVGTRAAHVASNLPQPSAGVAKAVRFENDAAAAKLTFDLSAPVAPTAFVLADPDRVIIDLPQIDFQADPSIGKPAGGLGRRAKKTGLVASFRFGLLSPGRSRIVVDLGAPAKIVSASSRAVDDHYELVVALTRTDRAAFRAAARGGTLAATTVSPSAAPVAPAPGKTTIVIDPGHGGPDMGAIVNGVIEKDVALAFAKSLADKLQGGGFNVVMTRATDVFIPLSERVRVARGANAALMISVHADTLADAADVSGATVYTVSDKASDAYAAKVAAKENAADAAVGVDGQQDKADVNDILFDLTRQETRAYSHVFARTLVNYWTVAGRLNKNPQRAAGFVVLKAPDVPSVLLELGYLSSPADSAALTSEAWRERAAGRAADAIKAYFADRQGPAKAAAGVPVPLPPAALLPAPLQPAAFAGAVAR